MARYLKSIDRMHRLILGRLDRRGRSPLQSQGRNGRACPLLGAAGQSDLADDDDGGFFLVKLKCPHYPEEGNFLGCSVPWGTLVEMAVWESKTGSEGE